MACVARCTACSPTISPQPFVNDDTSLPVEAAKSEVYSNGVSRSIALQPRLDGEI